MKTMTRLLSLFLCAVLLTGLLPAVSLAAQAEDRVDITDKFTDPVFREEVYSSIKRIPASRSTIRTSPR